MQVKHIFAGANRICTVSRDEDSVSSLLKKRLLLKKRKDVVADSQNVSFPQKRESKGAVIPVPTKVGKAGIQSTSDSSSSLRAIDIEDVNGEAIPSSTSIDYGPSASSSSSMDYGLSTVDCYYYHPDHLGSSNIITDDTGTQIQLLEYTPYGAIARETIDEGRGTSYKFTGKELDNTGLYFYGARYYDPAIGRFITADPTIQRPYDPQDFNRYAYCRNNPINYVDPSGLGWKSFWNKVGDFFKREVLQPAISFTVTFMLSGGNFIAATSAALATATLDTGEGRQFVSRTADNVFDDVFGMRQSTSYIWSNMISHAILASVYYIGLTTAFPQPSTGPDYTNPENQSEISQYAIEKGSQPGGSTANWIVEHGTDAAESQWYPQGRISSDIAWNDTPFVGKAFKALNVRHAAAVVNKGGTLFDSAKDISLKNLFKGEVYTSPWTATSHQAFFRTCIDGGMTGTQALSAATSHAGWSFYLTSSIYGVEGHFGAVGIVNAEVNRR